MASVNKNMASKIEAEILRRTTRWSLYSGNTRNLWQHNPMNTAGTYPPIDLGKDEPGMTLQYRERGYIACHLIWP